MQIVRNRRSIDLLHGSIFKNLLLFAIPFIISMLFQQLYNTVDVMIVGNMLGESALAAMGASSPIYDLLIGFSMGVANGLAVVTARSFGTGERRLIKRSVAMGLIIAAGLALCITLAAQLGAPALLHLLNTPEDIVTQSINYISTITLLASVTIAYNLLSAMMRAVGDSLSPMFFLIRVPG